MTPMIDSWQNTKNDSGYSTSNDNHDNAMNLIVETFSPAPLTESLSDPGPEEFKIPKIPKHNMRIGARAYWQIN